MEWSESAESLRQVLKILKISGGGLLLGNVNSSPLKSCQYSKQQCHYLLSMLLDGFIIPLVYVEKPFVCGAVERLRPLMTLASVFRPLWLC